MERSGERGGTSMSDGKSGSISDHDVISTAIWSMQGEVV
jgi:hypothetical protein